MKFELFNPKAKTTPIYYVIRKSRKGHNILLKYPTGISINPNQWNEKDKRVREITGIPFKQYNKTLDTIEREVKIIFSHTDYFSLTVNFLRAKLDACLERGTGASNDEFMVYLDMKVKENPKYTQLKNKLDKYSRLSWVSFNLKWMQQFVRDLEMEGLTRNYINKQISALKSLLNDATRDNLNHSEGYKHFNYSPEIVYKTYLTMPEVEAIYNIKDLSKPMDIIKDLFIVGCLTGLRVENYTNIDQSVSVDLTNNVLTAIVNKNGPRISIPIHYIIREIIEKYKGLPPPRSVWAINRGIKKIAEKAKINSTVISVREEGGVRTTTSLPKHKTITSHTCRRTLVTLLYLQNVKLEYIRSITGHKNIASTMRYIKAGLSEYQSEVAELDFWKKKT